MKLFELILVALKKSEAEGKKTGVVSMIRPDGTQPVPEGFTGGGTMNAGWGIVVDGNDDVFADSGLRSRGPGENPAHRHGTPAVNGLLSTVVSPSLCGGLPVRISEK